MSQGPADAMIYDDAEIRVIWSPGGSEFAVITFGDLLTPAKDLRFFGDAPLKKSDIASIGVMAKRGNWYPVENLRKAAGAILEKIGAYKTRLTYGGSMGGYAAIKFSGLLGATHTIALCPQWSIDRAECEGTDPGWGNYFNETMGGMGIKPCEVAGAVFIFADAYDARDMFHGGMIMTNYPAAHLINVPFAEHHVTLLFAGTSNFLELIDACRLCDLNALRGFSRRMRKRHPFWQRRILRHAMQKLPGLGIGLLAEGKLRGLMLENWRYFPRILGHLAATAGPERVLGFYEEYWTQLPGLAGQQLICAYIAGVTGRRVVIVTAHETWLIYDRRQSKVMHKGAPLEPWEIPVEAEQVGAAAALFVMVGASRFRLAVNSDGALVAPGIDGPSEGDFRFELGAGKKFSISLGGRYISADPVGQVVCNRDKAAAWELFRFGPLWRAEMSDMP